MATSCAASRVSRVWHLCQSQTALRQNSISAPLISRAGLWPSSSRRPQTQRMICSEPQWQRRFSTPPAHSHRQYSCSKPASPNRQTFEAEPARAQIRIVDYSSSQLSTQDVHAEGFDSFLQSNSRPEWATCRWIYVNGYDPDVVRCLGAHKGLHHLTVEDVLDPSTPVKVDWYHRYCYVVLALHKLVWLQPTGRGRAAEGGAMTDLVQPTYNTNGRIRWRTLSHNQFGISAEEVSAFLTPDNTVITIFEQSGEDVFSPLMERLSSPQTILRTSNDPSMLLQAVIDTIVDLAGPIEKAVAKVFTELERAVLLNPNLAQSKQLYVLRSGLSHLMESVVAIGSAVKVLSEPHPLPTGLPASQQPHSTVTISPLAQVYLRDVQDHINALLSSTRMAIRSAENLTSLIFNTIAASQNESVRQLTLVSSFFLPLTFLTGYFGMNFDPMPIVNDHSDAVFWLLATPVMLLTLTILGIRTGSFRRLARKQRTKSVPTPEMPPHR